MINKNEKLKIAYNWKNLMKKTEFFKILRSSILQDLKFITFVIILCELIYWIYKTGKIREISKIFNISVISSLANIIDNLKLNLHSNYFLLTIFIFSFVYLFFKIIQYIINNFKKIIDKQTLILIFLYSSVFIFISCVFIYKQSEDLFKPLIIFLLIISFIKLIIIIYWQYDNKNDLNENGFLMSDWSLEDLDDDELWFKYKAKDFSEIIYNNWDHRWLVFWLVAPWWAWKTTFLNFLQEQEIIYDNCMVFKFNPWYFENESVLLEKFILEFKSFLINESNTYLNELWNDLNILIKILWKKTNSLLWVDLDWWNNKDLYNTKKDINNSLKKINKKIIIVIDDLDRISSDKLRSVFKIINLCKDFYNTNFILCYDLSNFNNIDESLRISRTLNWDWIYSDITNEEFDNTNLVKYIEKIVNVQFSLYPDFDKLKEYFKKIFIKSELDFSEKSKEWIIEWIEKLFNIENYRTWWKHISDIRSIKRVYNNIVATNKLNNWDDNYIKNVFDSEEWLFFDIFIKLKLLSLSNNNLYLDIYNEVYLRQNNSLKLFGDIKDNKYLLNSEYLDWNTSYHSSSELIKYIKSLSIKEKELLESIFLIIKEKQKINISPRDVRVWNNLKNYFDLIEINKLAWFNRYIKNKVQTFFINPSDIIEIMSDVAEKYKEKWIMNFIITFEKSISDFPEWESIPKLLEYILGNFHKYSINSLASCWNNIARILEKTIRYENSNENCTATIWKYLYSTNTSTWIIDKFFNEDWWIKWLYNVLGLRLLAERGSSLWNFQRGIVWEKYELNLSKIVYFEKISKYIFWFFKKKYIDKNINIFEQLDNLTEEDLKVDDWVNIFWADTKAWIRAFIVYQLSNDNDWIWYYNLTNDENINNQNHWIKKVLNEYFFDKCFIWNKWIKYFIEYIFWFIFLPHFSDKKWVNSEHIKIRLLKTDSQDSNILNVFEEVKLISFIETNNESIDSFIELNYEKIFEWFNWVKFTYWFWWELFIKNILAENNTNMSSQIKDHIW
ncbi:MAG: hypothetical protein ACD_49C00049G0009 [uncultured bacterium (gcode 4)]|uniref:KAP NTPase domain-containing protein n=1 Tax=uncultured bacterium (gcode 4) TaxID=1234023 RepID=K2AXA1_9BACT|nr:MAG: hypothetical protein ACD_49C00049G0009 [uncultured bacterium (gcode 4)]